MIEDGKNPEDEWECSSCGASVAEDATVCPKCGEDISEIEKEKIRIDIKETLYKQRPLAITFAWSLLILSAISIFGYFNLGNRLFHGWNIVFNNPNPKLIVSTLIQRIVFNSFTIIAFFIGFTELKKRNNIKGKWIMYCSIGLFIITFIIF